MNEVISRKSFGEVAASFFGEKGDLGRVKDARYIRQEVIDASKHSHDILLNYRPACTIESTGEAIGSRRFFVWQFKNSSPNFFFSEGRLEV